MILVTGGAGFIGSNLVAGLERSGANDVVFCDQLGTNDKWRNIAKRDLTDLITPEDLTSYFDNNAKHIEGIFHLGAISATTEVNADFIIKNNFRLSCNLWGLCARYKIPFIYASSASTYGDGSSGFDDNIERTHLSTLTPLNAYGWSKHLFDRWVARLLESGLKEQVPPQWVGLKFFNVYGPNEYHKEGQISVALKNYREITSGSPAVLFRSHNPDYKDGAQSRDFIWVGDCVNVMLWLKNNPAVSGLFNLGTGKARSFFDLTKSIFDAASITPKIEFVDTPLTLRDKYQYYTEARMERLRNAGYIAPFTNIEDGVRQYVQNFLSTKDPYI